MKCVLNGGYVSLDLLKAGGEVKENGIALGGWKIDTFHGHMARDSELEDLKQPLGDVIRTPEIVFLRNNLRLCHDQSGLEIQFLALDALKAWISENLPPFKYENCDQLR